MVRRSGRTARGPTVYASAFAASSFHRTVEGEFHDIAFRKKLYRSVEELQTDLDVWLAKYNAQRPHSGRYCHGKTEDTVMARHLCGPSAKRCTLPWTRP
ncbi:MAG: transposase [Rhodobacteraceae bacterium]|nr:transposase [Paracoccaceae bacterium]